MLQVTVERRGAEPVLVRRAGAADAADLLAMAERLAELADLAVPRLLAVVHYEGGGLAVTTSYHPAAHPLSLRAIAEVAATLAAAHARGHVHGGLERSSIGMGQPGTVVLDGWRGAGTPMDDVEALGLLLAQLGDGDPAVHAAVARATAADPSTRPTMATLAHLLAEPPPARVSARGSRDPRGSRPSPAAPRSPRHSSRRARGRPRRTLLLLVAAAVALVALGPLSWFPGRGPRRDTSPAAADGAPSPTVSPSSPPGGAPVVTIAGRRWQVGEPGDVAVLGDWDCDGAAEPALLRADGSVWRWERAGGQPLRVGTTAHGVALAATSARGACDRLDVLDADGRRVSISPEDPA